MFKKLTTENIAVHFTELRSYNHEPIIASTMLHNISQQIVLIQDTRTSMHKRTRKRLHISTLRSYDDKCHSHDKEKIADSTVDNFSLNKVETWTRNLFQCR